MKIVFMGTPEFAVPSLKILHEHYEVGIVVTIPDKKQGRGLKTSESDVSRSAKELDIKTLKPTSLKDEAFVSAIKDYQPDFMVVVAFKKLPREVWSIPQKGTINLHASLLPKYRGAAPIHWAIINGETKTGATTFFINEKIDTGNILLKTEVQIDEAYNTGTLHDILREKGAALLLETIRQIDKGESYEVPQNLTKEYPLAPKLTRENTKIDINKTAREIHNMVRGLFPHPLSWAEMEISGRKEMVKIIKTELLEQKICRSERKKQVFISQNEIWINACDTPLKVSEIQRKGKRKMSSKTFLNGLK